MSSGLWAHSRNEVGVRHGLVDHLVETAALARGFAAVFGAGEVAWFLALVHDVGKGRCCWQAGLLRAERGGGRVVDERGERIDHKVAGTWLAARRAGLGLLAMVVLGHHGGLGDRQALRTALARAGGPDRAAVEEAIAAVAAVVPQIEPAAPLPIPGWALPPADACVAELLCRMVFSAVVDADFLDTERHFTRAARPRPVVLSGLAEVFERNRREYLAGGGGGKSERELRVDAIREQVYAEAVSAAAGPIGVYPFAAATGAGKTIAAAGFAVHHAARHGLARVVVAVPFLSITEQNAKVYRRLFGAEHVLEHHSGVDVDGLGPESRWQRLASENWDAPVVVTTTVQLFESLFGRNPSAMRKLHRLAGAVLVLDEVQSLPDELLLPILSVLRDLSAHFGTTVVLASATQPEFFSLDIFRDVVRRNVITQPQPVYDRLRRVEFEWWCDPRPTLAQIAAAAAAERQALVVVNTTRDAAVVHRLAEAAAAGVPVVHLSTRMAGGHRREVLAQIAGRLADGLPVVVVSTQLVEAGVDLDFPVVLRAYAPAEALLQAAGRCNRHGRLDRGRVVVFDPVDGSAKGTEMVYGSAMDTTRAYFGPGRDPDRLDLLSAYYTTRYAVKNIEATGTGHRIQQWRAEFNFPRVAAEFRMIDELSVPVLVPYGDDTEREHLRATLIGPDPVAPGVWRRLQPYLAALPRPLAQRAVTAGLATVLIGDPARSEDGRLFEWRGDYGVRGIEFPHHDSEDHVQ
ncbi:CRISPR-associated helicase Cas3' [Nocardia wallacei]|uniref:CRISPR-associated helicase Cas3' n=1 Tax=Nocardia wallacei TaxID=480035 RepID=UPI002457E566|nr:CRISPR-associated helicase Cas3' [Nocardia wallacei]